MIVAVLLASTGCFFGPARPAEFGPNSTTRQIALPGARKIRRVDFVMSNLPGDGRAKIELWAR